jgi:uncharacterized membrane-anchored protein
MLPDRSDENSMEQSCPRRSRPKRIQGDGARAQEAVEGSRSHGLLLDHQDPDDGDGRDDFGLLHPPGRLDEHGWASRRRDRHGTGARDLPRGAGGGFRYEAPIYWLTVVLVAVFGTMAADGVHVQLRVPYAVSTTFFALALAAVFVVWNRSERTLSIHSILTRRRELFYWAAVLTTFALGTAAGDLTAFTLHLGFFVSGVLFAVLIAVPAVGYWWFNLNVVFAFWFAYIVTRPLGASFADLLAAPKTLGGLGLGYGGVSVVLAVIILGLVSYLTVTRRDVQQVGLAQQSR